MDPDVRRPRRRRSVLAGLVAAAGLAVALPASGALAGGESEGSGSSSDSGVTPGFVQERDGDGRGDRRDCPKDRDRGGQESSVEAFDPPQQL
jgi:hypothetical protein